MCIDSCMRAVWMSATVGVTMSVGRIFVRCRSAHGQGVQSGSDRHVDYDVEVNAIFSAWHRGRMLTATSSHSFIRMEGTKTGANGIPPMSFSARFRLTDMKGKFNSTVLAAAQGKEGSAGGSSPSSPSSPNGGGNGMVSRPASSTSTVSRLVAPTPAGTSAFSRPAATNTPGAAGHIDVPKAAALLGAIAAGALALL